jgi:hypothetical protein
MIAGHTGSAPVAWILEGGGMRDVTLDEEKAKRFVRELKRDGFNRARAIPLFEARPDETQEVLR